MKHTQFSSKLLLALALFVTLGTSCLAAPVSTVDELADGRAALEAKDFEGAKAHLEKFVEANPKDAEGWKAMGHALFGMRWFQDSADCFAKADELAPEDGETLFFRGVLTLISSTKLDKDARGYFDRSAALESPYQALANLMKYSMLKYINIKGRSVSKEFDKWRGELPADSWEAQLANYLRRPVSNETLTKQCEAHMGSRDAVDLELQRRLFIAMKNESTLYGLAADNLKKALKLHKPGSVEWELARVWYWRFGFSYNWETRLTFEYGPNERGELEVVIKDRESFAMARGLRNKDEIVSFNGQPADLNLLDATFNDMKVGEAFELVIRRDGEEKKLLLIMDTEDFRMRPAKPR